jgi:hypothetical protein
MAIGDGFMMSDLKWWRLLLKTMILFAVFNFVLTPLLMDEIEEGSLYNWVIPGRLRLPFGEDPGRSYNLSLFSLDASFASHVVSDPGAASDAYRVFVFGDSSMWGTLLRPEETLVGQLNALNLETENGSPIRFFNLGYPTLSLTKDLMLLEKGLGYDPDLIVWLVTLESFPNHKQYTSPIVSHNYPAVRELILEYDLDLDPDHEEFIKPGYWDSTLIGQRRNLADIFRLQVYGIMWGITRIDQHYPESYEPAQRDLDPDPSFYQWDEGEMETTDLAYSILKKTDQVASGIPILIVNEPILISEGANSDIRYNFYYPIWAYDQYRSDMQKLSSRLDWNYVDLWDLVPEEEFTNSAIHLTPRGESILAEKVSDAIMSLLASSPSVEE